MGLNEKIMQKFWNIHQSLCILIVSEKEEGGNIQKIKKLTQNIIETEWKEINLPIINNSLDYWYQKIKLTNNSTFPKLINKNSNLSIKIKAQMNDKYKRLLKQIQ